MRLEGDGMGGGSLPRWVKPQLCALVGEPPEGSEWLHEIKYDGYRTYARLDGSKTQLLTRTGLDWTHKYAPIADALSLLPVQQAYLDGALCGVRPDGKTSFSLIQAASDSGKSDVLVFFLFDPPLPLWGRDQFGAPAGTEGAPTRPSVECRLTVAIQRSIQLNT
jgi:ATP-dependent DNA ligase